MILTSSGQVYWFGVGLFAGQGYRQVPIAPTPVPTFLNLKVLDIVQAGDSSALLLRNGSVMTFGNNIHRQICHPWSQNIYEPKLVQPLPSGDPVKFIEISATSMIMLTRTFCSSFSNQTWQRLTSFGIDRVRFALRLWL